MYVYQVCLSGITLHEIWHGTEIESRIVLCLRFRAVCRNGK